MRGQISAAVASAIAALEGIRLFGGFAPVNAERCGADTNSPCGYLPLCNLCTFMALGIRACLQSVEVYLVLIGSYISPLRWLRAGQCGEMRCRHQQTARNVYFLHLVIVLYARINGIASFS
jgi:hypothetical protein